MRRFEHPDRHRRARRIGHARSRWRALLLGDAPDFHVEPIAYASATTEPLYFVLGAARRAGGGPLQPHPAGERSVGPTGFARWPVELRAALVGARGRRLAWFAPGPGRRRRSADPARAHGHRVAGADPGRVPAAPRARRGLLRRRHAGRAVRAAAGARRPARPRSSAGLLPLAFPGLGVQPEALRRGRHGRVLHRRGARAADRHRAGHRDDRQRRRCCCRCSPPASPRCWSRRCSATRRSTTRCASACSGPAQRPAGATAFASE